MNDTIQNARILFVKFKSKKKGWYFLLKYCKNSMYIVNLFTFPSVLSCFVFHIFL